MAKGYIRADMESHGGLKITPEGAAFLKNKGEMELRFEEKITKLEFYEKEFNKHNS
jgi:DNA-binding PadR family transcriptional regulator